MFVMDHYYEVEKHVEIRTQGIVMEMALKLFSIKSWLYRPVTLMTFGARICTAIPSHEKSIQYKPYLFL